MFPRPPRGPSTIKDVHVKLEVDKLLPMRMKLLEYNISMQEAFRELSRLIATGDPKGLSVLDGIVKRKFKALEEVIEEPTTKPVPFPGLKPLRTRELDDNALYILIEQGLKDEEASG